MSEANNPCLHGEPSHSEEKAVPAVAPDPKEEAVEARQTWSPEGASMSSYKRLGSLPFQLSSASSASIFAFACSRVNLPGTACPLGLAIR